MSRFGRTLYIFLSSPFIAEPDVFGDGSGEEESLLRYDPDLSAEPQGIQFSNINAIECNRAFGWVIEAKEQIGNSGLPGTAWSNQRQTCPTI